MLTQATMATKADTVAQTGHLSDCHFVLHVDHTRAGFRPCETPFVVVVVVVVVFWSLYYFTKSAKSLFGLFTSNGCNDNR